jgi:phosphoglycolate phosphatase
LLFDLDGTLTDSRLGVTRCIRHALAEAGVVAPPLEELTRYVGPPLLGTFAALLRTSDSCRIEAAIAAYRQRFEQVGMFENRLYPGVRQMLAALASAGHELRVVTAKPRPYARQILEHFGMATLFHDVHGPDLGARDYTKAALIRDACTSAPVLPGAAVMIGDRAEDVLGARSNGVGSVAVTWGYGDRAELEAAHPDRMVTSTGELVEYVLGQA